MTTVSTRRACACCTILPKRSPAQAQEVHAFLRERIAKKNKDIADGLQILYGGSMKPGNAAELMAKPDIDGGLIGGAALKAADFLGICKAADESV